ncbi:hypothetical protein GH714_010028 [Hevea brasiliensis]|uniref:Uncharacterized protein n=1 Tax=Hevea brasiliensis TaxID=3981 RepID=A0A6A6N3E4_HEVBR|nr:hypothetical protein GH714_010028 [Hevea brasiliensis]
MSRDAGCLTDGEIGYDNSSRIEPKRGHQWFMDTTEPELFSNKRQAVEAVGNRPVLGTSHMNISPWHNASSFQSVSGQFSDRLFGSEAVQTNNMVDRNVPSAGGGNMNINMGRKEFNDQYEKLKSIKLGAPAMPFLHPWGTPLAEQIAMRFQWVLPNKNESNAISLGPTYNNAAENTISIGPNFSKADGNFITMGHTFNKGDENFISMGHNYNKGDDGILSMGQPFDKADANFITMGPSYEKDDSNVISMAHSFSEGMKILFNGPHL